MPKKSEVGFMKLLLEMGIDVDNECEDVVEEIRSLYYTGYYDERS